MYLFYEFVIRKRRWVTYLKKYQVFNATDENLFVFIVNAFPGIVLKTFSLEERLLLWL